MIKLPVLFFLLFLFACSGVTSSYQSLKAKQNPVIAHRGAFKKKQLPQNSLAALQEAIRLRCYGSEFDVRMTADDTLIIKHDPSYKGLDIEKSTYRQLAALPLPNGEPLPTLYQYLMAGKQNNTQTRMVLEIKPSPAGKERVERIAEKCVALVHQTGSAANTVYISFDYDALKKVRALDPNAPTQYLNGDITPEQLKQDGISGLDYHLSVYKKNPDWIARAKSNHRVLNAWTVNTRADMAWLLDSGFHFITTDEPEMLFELLKERK